MLPAVASKSPGVIAVSCEQFILAAVPEGAKGKRREGWLVNSLKPEMVSLKMIVVYCMYP